MFFGRRNPWVSLFGLVVIVCVFTYVLRLKPWLFHAMNPIDPSPPEWGSSATFSTDAGFLRGKWIAHVDESSARSKNKIAQFALNSASESLEFLPGDRFVWNNMGDVVKGRWKDDATRISLSPETVDDVPVKLALDRLAAQQALPMKSPEFNRKWLSEGSSVQRVQKLGTIQLMPDRKRLFCTGNIDQNGRTPLGTTVWDRVKR